MNELLSRYFYACFHPWLLQDALYKKRKSSSLEKWNGVSFYESLSISWLFSIFNATYLIIGMTMGLHTLQLAENEVAKTMGLGTGNYFAYNIFTLLMKVVFFPLIFWFYGRFWVGVIKIFANLFEKELDMEDLDELCEIIVANSLTTHAFLVIPLLGTLIQKLSFFIYLFAGLRRNMKFSVLQSTIILLCPLVLILLAFFLMLMSFILLITSF